MDDEVLMVFDVHRAAPIKRTAVEKQVNVHIIFLFGFLLALSVGSTIGASINTVSGAAMSYPVDDMLIEDGTSSGSSPVNNGISYSRIRFQVEASLGPFFGHLIDAHWLPITSASIRRRSLPHLPSSVPTNNTLF